MLLWWLLWWLLLGTGDLLVALMLLLASSLVGLVGVFSRPVLAGAIFDCKVFSWLSLELLFLSTVPAAWTDCLKMAPAAVRVAFALFFRG